MSIESLQLYDAAFEPNLEELAAMPEEELADPNVLAREFPSNNLVYMYLKDIAKVPLLTAEQEQELLLAISAGSTAKAQQADAPAEEQDALRKTVRKGSRARQDLTESSMRLVLTVAKRYVGRGLPFLDLIQEGSLGLMQAIEKFDLTMPCKFSVYAAWWIQQAVSAAIQEQSEAASIPVHMIESYNKLTRLNRQMTEELGRNPSTQELADAMKMTPDEVLEIFKIAQDSGAAAAAAAEEEDNLITEADEAAEEENAPSQALMDALEVLSPQEALILKLHFGLEDGQPHTLEDVGEEFGMETAQVQNIISTALGKLQEQHPELRKALS